MRANAPEFVPSQHRLSTASTASTTESTSISTTTYTTTFDNPITARGEENNNDGPCNLEKPEVIVGNSISETKKKSSSFPRRARKKRNKSNDQKISQYIVTANDQKHLNSISVSFQRSNQQESQRNNYQQHRIEIAENKNNSHRAARRKEKQGSGQRKEKMACIPQMVSSQRKDNVQDAKELLTFDLFPPLHVPSDSKISLGTSTKTKDQCGSNRILRQQYMSKWSKVIINAHLDQFKQKIYQQRQNTDEKKTATSSTLTFLKKHQSTVEDGCSSSSSSSTAAIDDKEEATSPQDNIDVTILNIDQLLQSTHNNNNNYKNKLIKTTRLKQRWIQILDSKFPTATRLEYSSIHPATSMEVPSSMAAFNNYNDWENIILLRHTAKNNQTVLCPSTDDDSSYTYIHSTTKTTTNCLANDLSFTCINANTKDGSRYSEVIKRSDSPLSELANYSCKPFPLHTAILHNNLLIFQYLLCQDISLTQSDQLASWEDLSCIPPPLVNYDEEKSKIKMRPIHLSIILDKYEMVKAIVDHEKRSNNNWESLSIDSLNNCYQTPLMVACYLGLEAYVSLLLTNGAKIIIKDNNGDTALHHCCRSNFLTGIELILNSARNRNTSNTLHRILCARNGKGQTPYHTACRAGDNTVIDKLLSVSSVAITIKALQICDDNGRTPLLFAIENGTVAIVESLILWRRNQHRFLKHKANYDALEVSSSIYCPLLLAIQSENLEMLRVLLELWGGMKNSLIDKNTLDSALLHAAQSTGSFQHDAICMLIEYGANPFEPSDAVDNNNSFGFSTSKSVVSFLSCCGDISSLKVTLDSFQLASNQLREQRRQDHFLRSRPSFYFETIEKKEDDMVMSGMQDALIDALLTSWRNNGPNDVGRGKSLLTSAYLLKLGAVINEAGYSRLLAGLSKMCSGKRLIATLTSCRTKYTHLVLPVKKRGTSRKQFNKQLSAELSMSYWSEVLSGIPWLWSHHDASTTENFCGWWREKLRAVPGTPSVEMALERKDACFLVVGGDRYLAHKSILSAKSKKLAAAFRFSLLQQQKKGNECLDEVELDIPLHMLSFLMQHCYHGSLFFGLSAEIDVCSQELIELALVADEYICPTLLAECEMRLISLSGAKNLSCFCWCCCSNVQRNCMEGEGDFICKVQSTIDCDYTVSLPPVTALSNNVEVAVTVLALCQQWAPFYCTGYEVTAYGVDSSRCHFRYPMHQPFMVAKLLSLKTILFYGFWPECNYNTLLSFLAITERVGDVSSRTSPIRDETKTVALLEYCLEELAKYTLQ